MKDRIYIIFNRKGIRSLTKRTKKSSHPAGTYMAELNLEVDDAFFENQIPKVNVVLGAENIIEPQIEVEEKQTPLQMFFSEIDKESEK